MEIKDPKQPIIVRQVPFAVHETKAENFLGWLLRKPRAKESAEALIHIIQYIIGCNRDWDPIFGTKKTTVTASRPIAQAATLMPQQDNVCCCQMLG